MKIAALVLATSIAPEQPNPPKRGARGFGGPAPDFFRYALCKTERRILSPEPANQPYKVLNLPDEPDISPYIDARDQMVRFGNKTEAIRSAKQKKRRAARQARAIRRQHRRKRRGR